MQLLTFPSPSQSCFSRSSALSFAFAMSRSGWPQVTFGLSRHGQASMTLQDAKSKDGGFHSDHRYPLAEMKGSD